MNLVVNNKLKARFRRRISHVPNLMLMSKSIVVAY